MKISVMENSSAFDREGAMFFTRQVLMKPDTFFGLATGNTTRNIFAIAAELYRELEVDYSQAKTCNLDEYAGIPAEDRRSCSYRINEVLLGRINIKPENTYIPNGLSDPPEKELEVFKEKIKNFGGIDLLVLGIGTNGHVGFNEPGTPFDSSFRIATLSETTRKDKAAFFGGLNQVPRFGISMGIRDIMMARRILLVAKGKSKAEVIHRIVEGPMTTDVPASIVRMHSDLFILADRDAASLL